MSDPKQPWTPGPWELFGGRVIRAVNRHVATPLAETVTPFSSVLDSSPDLAAEHANGVLMAAAPAGAEALALFVQCLDASREPTTNPLRLALDRDRCEKAARAALVACGWLWYGR